MSAETTPESALLGHAHANRHFEALASAITVGDLLAFREAFARFEADMLQHFAAEEEHLFPAYAAADAEDEGALRSEHADLRAALADLRASVERGEIDRNRELMMRNKFLMHHAHEETKLYRWARERD